MVVTFNNKNEFMKAKILFLTALLALIPTFCTVSYGQGLLGTALKSALGTEKKNNKAKASDARYARNDESNDNNTTNTNDEVTLIVSGKAVDSEKATTIALRSAIEQAYGTFVSANTTILNDDLVKDEIVTISNGNIKSYNVLSKIKCEDNQVMVTIDATVCISKLVSYAKSKGASTEFAGATFAQNMKIKELNKKNELQALRNLIVMTKEMLPLAYNMKLSIAEPVIPEINIRTEAIIKQQEPIYAEPHSDEIEEQYRKYLSLADGYYQMQFLVYMAENDNTDKIFGNISNTLKAIALNLQEEREYEKTNIKMSRIEIEWPRGYEGREYDNKAILYFRNSQENINKIFSEFTNIFLADFSNFEIVDNLGNTSSFNGLLMGTYRGDSSENNKEVELFKNNNVIWFIGGASNGSRIYFTTQATGLFKEGVMVEPRVPYFYEFGCVAFYNGDVSGRSVSMSAGGGRERSTLKYIGNNFGSWNIIFKIPVSEISKYSDFKLAPKSK